MDVSIIIVNYNTCQITKDCISSILQHTKGIEYEIIVVDNASIDESISQLSIRKDILFIESGENLGFGRANNLGAKHASGKYLFFLNSDTILLNNAIFMLFDYFESHKQDKLGVLGGWLLDTDCNTTTSYMYEFPHMTRVLRNVFEYIQRKLNIRNSYKLESNQINKDVEIVSGADMMIPNTLFCEVGGFDSDYFMYGEEGELQYRIYKRGYLRRIINGPEIIHLEGKSSEKKNKKLTFFQFYSMKRGELLFYRKHKCFLYSFVAGIIQLIVDLMFISLDSRFSGKRLIYLKLYSLIFPFVKIKTQITDRKYYM